MEYVIVSENYSCTLDKAVNDRIRDGWIPQGGIATSIEEVPIVQGYPNLHWETTWHQVMIRETETRK